MPFRAPFLTLILLATIVITSGCASTSVTLDSPQHQETIADDRATLQGSQDTKAPQNLSLSIDQALDMAVKENLDAHVSALEYLSTKNDVTLEQIKALPSLQYNITRHGRSNQPASSSLSILTGQQSLEPSVSTERYRSTRDITLNWNLIDAASALVQAKTADNQATISAERYKKVIQNIHRDVYSAYWRARADSEARGETKQLITEAKAHIKKLNQAAAEKLISKNDANLKKAPYLESIKVLKDLENESSLALIELKSILNLPQTTQVVLTSEPSDPSALSTDIVNMDIETLETSALLSRPEMREAFMNKNISIRDTKQEIIRTIPGAEIFFGLNRDTNDFLANDSWRSYSASLVQSITSLLTLPERYIIARKNEKLIEARRVTLAAAIITQVHIARHGLAYSQELYNAEIEGQKDAQYQAYSMQKKLQAGHVAKSAVLLSKMQAREKTLQLYQAHANVKDSYAAMVNTLGFEVKDKVTSTALKARVS